MLPDMAATPRLVPWATRAASRVRPTPRLVAAERGQGAGQAGPAVHAAQHVLDADLGQAGADDGPQLAQPGRDRQGVVPAQLQLAVTDRGEQVAGQASGRRTRALVKAGAQGGEGVVGPGRHGQVGVGILFRLRPLPLAHDQVPERDVSAARGEEQVARAQGVTHRKGERQPPQRPARPPVAGTSHLAPGGRDEVPGRVVEKLLRRPRIQLAGDLDGGEQGLAAGGCLEGQGQKGGQVFAEVAVARGQLVQEAAFLQPGEGAAVRGGLAQLFLAQILVEGANGRVLVGVEQGVHSGEQRVDAGPGTPAQPTVLVLERQAGAPVQPGHVLVVHGHDLIEQRPAGLDQEGRDERVALGRGEALERLGIVPAPELGEVLEQLRCGCGEIHPGSEQPFQQVELGKARRDRRCPRRGRGFLEVGERGAVLAFRHVHQVLDRVTEPRRQPDAMRSNSSCMAWAATETTRRSNVLAAGSTIRAERSRSSAEASDGPGAMPSAACSCSRARSPCSAASSNSCQPRCRRTRWSWALSVAGRSGSGRNSSGSRPSWRARWFTASGGTRR